MKKIIFLACLILAVSACTVNEAPEVNTFTETYTVSVNHWKLAQDDDFGDYYYYEFREPALTRDIYERGILNSYLKIGESLYPLPFDDYWIDKDYRWTEQVTCEFKPGYITFILRYNDYKLNEPPHYDYNFLVRFMW
ncbi:hypothetical protein FACS189426_02600 [Bacteroidia bacterium]|nr:hypothetical protein FACS189426_02600 [Bacteroidia bacterium]